MHADVSAVSVKREADDVTECSHDDLSAITTGEVAAVSRLRTFPVCDELRLNVIVSLVLFVIVQCMPWLNFQL